MYLTIFLFVHFEIKFFNSIEFSIIVNEQRGALYSLTQTSLVGGLLTHTVFHQQNTWVLGLTSSIRCIYAQEAGASRLINKLLVCLEIYKNDMLFNNNPR